MMNICHFSLRSVGKCVALSSFNVKYHLRRPMRFYMCQNATLSLPSKRRPTGFRKQNLLRIGHSNLSNNCMLKKEFCSQNDVNLNYEDLHRLKLKGEIILIDVREPEELKESGILPDSINIPMNALEFALQQLSDKEFKLKYGIEKPTADAPLVFSCAAGKRSEAALKQAIKIGYTKARHYQGGFIDWKKNSTKK